MPAPRLRTVFWLFPWLLEAPLPLAPLPLLVPSPILNPSLSLSEACKIVVTPQRLLIHSAVGSSLGRGHTAANFYTYISRRPA